MRSRSEVIPEEAPSAHDRDGSPLSKPEGCAESAAPEILFGQSWTRANKWQLIAFVICSLFGIAMIANANGAADGTWIWYGLLFNKGVKLYSQLHMVQQPFFVLETAWLLSLFGKSWLATKIPATLHVFVYVAGLFWIARYASLSDRQKALLAGAAFFLSINTVAFRFDDYHVVAESLAVYSIVALLAMYRSRSDRRILALSATVGVLSALAIETRVTNGAGLFVATAISIVCIARTRKLLAVAVSCLAAALTIALLVRFTGDTFHDYWMYSVGTAAGSKGGVGSVLRNPISLPWNALVVLKPRRFTALPLMFVASCCLWAFLIMPSLRRKSAKSLALAGIGLLFFAVMLGAAYNHGLRDFGFLYCVSTLGVFALYALGIAAIVGVILQLVSAKTLPGWSPLQSLILIPWAHLAAGAMSSGGLHGEYYAPIGLLVLLLPIAFPNYLGTYGRSFLIAAASLLICFCFIRRVEEPYRWLGFQSKPMFVGRQWFMHPVYGPMIMEHDLLNFIQPICGRISAGSAGRELFSSPYSYANYFCDIPPWRDYVQTWYDTTNPATIQRLTSDLNTSPPEWILYQREPEILRLHEMVFHGGQPTAYRQIGDLLDEKLASGAWKTEYRSDFGSSGAWNEGIAQEWLLIKTR
jgi:hypothetical protein